MKYCEKLTLLGPEAKIVASKNNVINTQYLSMYLKADIEFGYITLSSSNASMQLMVYLLTKREKHCLSFLESI